MKEYLPEAHLQTFCFYSIKDIEKSTLALVYRLLMSHWGLILWHSFVPMTIPREGQQKKHTHSHGIVCCNQRQSCLFTIWFKVIPIGLEDYTQSMENIRKFTPEFESFFTTGVVNFTSKHWGETCLSYCNLVPCDYKTF